MNTSLPHIYEHSSKGSLCRCVRNNSILYIITLSLQPALYTFLHLFKFVTNSIFTPPVLTNIFMSAFTQVWGLFYYLSHLQTYYRELVTM